MASGPPSATRTREAAAGDTAGARGDERFATAESEPHSSQQNAEQPLARGADPHGVLAAEADRAGGGRIERQPARPGPEVRVQTATIERHAARMSELGPRPALPWASS